MSGNLRSLPKAFEVTFGPGAAWNLLYSDLANRRAVFSTIFLSKPFDTIFSTEISFSTKSFKNKIFKFGNKWSYENCWQNFGKI